jgi:hypothetical protein
LTRGRHWPPGSRPNVRSGAVTAGGALRVTISAGRSDQNAANGLRSVTFGAVTNARIEVPVQAGIATAQQGTGGFTVQINGNPVDLAFTVTRLTPGQATTVPITVVDACGEWKTSSGRGRRRVLT